MNNPVNKLLLACAIFCSSAAYSQLAPFDGPQKIMSAFEGEFVLAIGQGKIRAEVVDLDKTIKALRKLGHSQKVAEEFLATYTVPKSGSAELKSLSEALLSGRQELAGISMRMPLTDRIFETALTYYKVKGTPVDSFADGKYIYFGSLPDATGQLVSADLQEFGISLQLDNGEPVQIKVVGDLNGLMLKILEKAFGSKRVVILHSNLIPMFMAGGLEAEIASGVLVHELNHALRDVTEHEASNSEAIHSEAEPFVRGLTSAAKNYFETDYFRASIDGVLERLATLSRPPAASDVRPVLDAKFRNPTQVRIASPSYFSIREYPAFRAQMDFLKERGLTFDDVMRGSIQMASRAVTWNPETSDLYANIVAPHFWMMLSEAYGRK